MAILISICAIVKTNKAVASVHLSKLEKREMAEKKVKEKKVCTNVESDDNGSEIPVKQKQTYANISPFRPICSKTDQPYENTIF